MSNRSSEENPEAQILKLIQEKPMRWSELKNITGLSSATLFRIVSRLEDSKKVERVLQKKGIRWKITKRGERDNFINRLARFLKKGRKIPQKVSFVFDYWEPLTKEQAQERAASFVFEDGEDGDYWSLETKELAREVLESVNKELIEKLKTSHAGLSMSIEPAIFTLKEPKDIEKAKKFAEKLVMFLDKNKEKWILSFLPTDTVEGRCENIFRNETTVVLKIDFEVDEKTIDKLEKSA